MESDYEQEHYTARSCIFILMLGYVNALKKSIDVQTEKTAIECFKIKHSQVLEYSYGLFSSDKTMILEKGE